MATVTQLRDRIKSRLSRRTAGSVTNTEIIDALDHAQVEILEQDEVLPNFLERSSEITRTGVHSNIPLAAVALDPQAEFIRPWHEADSALAYKDATSVGYKYFPIYRADSLELARQKYPGQGTIAKLFYWLGDVHERSYLLFPEVTVTTEYLVRYYRKAENIPSSPDGNDSTVWTIRAADLLMHTAGLEVAQWLRDKDAISYFSAKRQEAYSKFKKRVIAEQMAAQELVMGE